jgi:hypothetical protein
LEFACVASDALTAAIDVGCSAPVTVAVLEACGVVIVRIGVTDAASIQGGEAAKEARAVWVTCLVVVVRVAIANLAVV